MTETTKLECKDFAIVIPLTQGKIARVALEDYALISRFKWHAFEGKRGLWYARRWRKGPSWEWMHRLIIGASKGQQVDHRNGDSLDNHRDNLRLATASLNSANRKRSTGQKLRYKGVRRSSDATVSTQRPWLSNIRKNYRYFFLGSFRTAEEAARAYDAKARELYGEFACVNFPEGQERQA